MRASTILRLSLVILGLTFTSLAARPCRAQAEISPDHYDEAPALPSTAPKTTRSASSAGKHVTRTTACHGSLSNPIGRQSGCVTRRRSHHNVRSLQAFLGGSMNDGGANWQAVKAYRGLENGSSNEARTLGDPKSPIMSLLRRL